MWKTSEGDDRRSCNMLFVYFQVNIGVWHFLDYVEDVYDDDGPPRILESCYVVAYHAFTRCTTVCADTCM